MSSDQVGSGFRVIQQIELTIHLKGWIVSDVLEIERPLPGQGADLAAHLAPVAKVMISAVVRDVAGLVSRDSIFSALALWHYMVVVELSLFDKAATEVTGHNLPCVFCFRGGFSACSPDAAGDCSEQMRSGEYFLPYSDVASFPSFLPHGWIFERQIT